MSDNDILIPDSSNLSASTNRNHLYRLSLFVEWLDQNDHDWHAINHAIMEAYITYLEQERALAPRSIYAHISTIRNRYDELVRVGTRIHPKSTGFTQIESSAEKPQFPSAPRAKSPFDQFPKPSISTMPQVTPTSGQLFRPPLVVWDALSQYIFSQIKQEPASEHVRLNVEQANTFLNRPGTDTLQGLRDTALIALMLCTGVRESEVRELDVTNLHQTTDDDVPVLHVPNKEGCIERFIPFGNMLWARDLAQQWLDAAEITEGPLFRGFYKGGQSVRPNRISLRSVGLILGNYPLETDEGPLKVTSLMVRRTYAKLLYEQGVRVNTIQQYLGLGSSDTTTEYIGLNESDDLDDSPPSLYSSL